MPLTHTVQPGEHLAAIARSYGFENFQPIWEHPENAQLKAKREEPSQLAPGDALFIPDRVRLVFSRMTDASHDVQVRVDTLTLNLRLLNFDGEPYKNTEVTLRVEAPATNGASLETERTLTTDDEGKLSVDIAKHVTSGTMLVDGVEYPLSIGQLDPIDSDNGVAQRLQNLGYLPPRDEDDEPEPDADELTQAISDFQGDNELDVTGKREDVEDKLKDVYGS